MDDIDEETDLERGFAGPSGRLSDILPDIEILTAQYRDYRIEILSSLCNIIPLNMNIMIWKSYHELWNFF